MTSYSYFLAICVILLNEECLGVKNALVLEKKYSMRYSDWKKEGLWRNGTTFLIQWKDVFWSIFWSENIQEYSYRKNDIKIY